MAADSPTIILRNGPAARAVGSALLIGALLFGAVMGELTLRSTFLRCEPAVGGAAACTLEERWPAFPSRRTAMAPVVSARTRAEAGTRGSVALLLEHADLTVSEHLGVGERGERAETIALRMRTHLESGRSSIVLPLRQAAPIFGAGLLIVFCGISLLLLPALFARVRFSYGPSASVRVGRGLLPARRLSLRGELPPELVVRTRVVAGNTMHTLHLVTPEEDFDLGLSSNSPEWLEKHTRLIRDFIQQVTTSRRPATGRGSR